MQNRNYLRVPIQHSYVTVIYLRIAKVTKESSNFVNGILTTELFVFEFSRNNCYENNWIKGLAIKLEIDETKRFSKKRLFLNVETKKLITNFNLLCE